MIRSVYDFDGVDKVAAETDGAVPNIAALADPKQATADQRPARFVRIEKAVEIPDKKVRKINNSAFGPAGMGMREILAYAPVEPDGSVKIEVPANVPFTIDILDKNARRIGPRHTSWMQLMPGETKTCNGCHTAGSKTTPSHGRSGLTASVNAGAPAAGAPFPNTLASLSGRQCRRHHGGDPGVEHLPDRTPRRHHRLLANAEHRCDLRRTCGPIRPPPRAPRTPASPICTRICRRPSRRNTHCTTWDPLCRSTIHYPDATAAAARPTTNSAAMEFPAADHRRRRRDVSPITPACCVTIR